MGLSHWIEVGSNGLCDSGQIVAPARMVSYPAVDVCSVHYQFYTVYLSLYQLFCS